MNPAEIQARIKDKPCYENMLWTVECPGSTRLSQSGVDTRFRYKYRSVLEISKMGWFQGHSTNEGCRCVRLGNMNTHRDVCIYIYIIYIYTSTSHTILSKRFIHPDNTQINQPADIPRQFKTNMEGHLVKLTYYVYTGYFPLHHWTIASLKLVKVPHVDGFFFKSIHSCYHSYGSINGPFSGIFRTLKWRYCTILCGDIPWNFALNHRPQTHW